MSSDLFSKRAAIVTKHKNSFHFEKNDLNQNLMVFCWNPFFLTQIDIHPKKQRDKPFSSAERRLSRRPSNFEGFGEDGRSLDLLRGRKIPLESSIQGGEFFFLLGLCGFMWFFVVVFCWGVFVC